MLQIFTLTSASDLRKHIKIIQKIHKNCRCESCGKSFIVANTRIRHEKTIHKDQKDFICSSCGESFTQASYLRLLGLLLLGFISKQFMKITKISNVNVVENQLLKLVIREYIWKPFLNIKKISNVTLVDLHMNQLLVL